MKRWVLILVLLALASTSFAVWPPAIRLTDGPNQNINPGTFVHAQPIPGVPLILVWQRGRLGGWDIYSRENRYGYGWFPPVLVSSLPDSNLTPTIAAYPSYRYCAWVNCHGDSQNILCSRWNRTDSTWAPAMYVTQDSFPDLEPSVWCMAYRDSAAVAWASLRNGHWNLYTRFYNGTSWSPIIPVVTDSGNNRCPRFFSIGYDLSLQLAWQSDVRGNWDIYTSQYTMGSWTAPRRITNGIQADVQPSPVKGMNSAWREVNLLWASDSLSNWEVFGTEFDSIPPPVLERFTSHDSSDSEPSALNHAFIALEPVTQVALSHPVLTAWTSLRDGNANIYAEFCYMVVERVNSNPAVDRHPSVAATCPDGQWIYEWVIWQSNRDGNWNLYGSYQIISSGGVESGGPGIVSKGETKMISPSPFRPPGRMTFFFPGSRSDISFRFYDLQGRDVGVRRAEKKAPGKYELTWDGRNQQGHALPSGLYFLRAEGSPNLFRLIMLR